MKILCQGAIRKLPEPVWIGQEVFCLECRFQAVLEQGDKGITIDVPESAIRPGQLVQITLQCPTCRNTIRNQFNVQAETRFRAYVNIANVSVIHNPRTAKRIRNWKPLGEESR